MVFSSLSHIRFLTTNQITVCAQGHSRCKCMTGGLSFLVPFPLNFSRYVLFILWIVCFCFWFYLNLCVYLFIFNSFIDYLIILNLWFIYVFISLFVYFFIYLFTYLFVCYLFVCHLSIICSFSSSFIDLTIYRFKIHLFIYSLYYISFIHLFIYFSINLLINFLF